MKNADINMKSVKELEAKSLQSVKKLKKYSTFLFFLAFALVYGYMLMKIGTLSNAPVDQDEVTLQISSSPSLKIDEEAVKQLNSLKDNSVNVQTLFDQGRTNPFQE